ncbi:MAG: DUF4271 domain-containing protein [Bacteroidetes bacterium]|nr:DUF4271 domain-containing protein [Bacteroidota bacterium]
MAQSELSMDALRIFTVQSLFVIFAPTLFNCPMLLFNTSLLSATNTKTGQAPSRKVKALATKSVQKKLQTEKKSPETEKQLREEQQIIQAAERYHQQISGKKTGPAVEQEINTTPVSTNFSTVDVPGNGADRDLSINIYTGNPGFYTTEGDTLNLWSFTPVPVDSSSVKIAVVEQPVKPYGFVGKPMKTTGQDWTFFLVLIGWTIFASLRFGFSKYMVQVFQGVFNFSSASRLYRERGYNSNFGLFRLNLIFYLFLPFPIYLIARDNGMSLMGFSGIEFYLIVLVVVNAYFLLKILLYRILGSVFSQREATGELIFNMMLFNNVLGLILLPVATIHLFIPRFGPFSIFIVPGLIIIFYLLSLVRSIYFAIREGISIFYLILYLCALEILPILLVVKLAIEG